MKKTLSVILSVIIMMTFAFTSLGASIAVKSIKSGASKITLQVGKTYALKVTITPTNATNKKLTYSSSNKKIATVDKNGKIKGIKAGKTVITVVSSSNKKAVAKCNVTIISKVVKKELSTDDLVKKAREISQLVANEKSAVIEGNKKIGIVMPTLDNGGWLAIYAGALRSVLKSGVGAVTFSANNDVAVQMNIIEDLIAKKVDGIVFVPTDSAALSAAVEKANAAGIPIVAMDRSTSGGKLAGLVESDNVEIGREAARQMSKLATGKEFKIFNLQGDMATSAGVERNKGFVEEIAKSSNCEIVGEISGFWRADKGNAAVLDALQAHPDINAIYLPSDAYTQGVIAALDQMGKLKPIGDPKHITIVSVDGQPIGLENVRKDYIDVDVGQALFTVGEQAVETCVKAINGEKIENTNVKLPPEVISKVNVDSPDLWGNQMK